MATFDFKPFNNEGNRKVLIGMVVKYPHKTISHIISWFSASTHCPIIAAWLIYGHEYGFTTEVLNAIKQAKQFHQISDIINYGEGK